jgi:hypothetical protein
MINEISLEARWDNNINWKNILIKIYLFHRTDAGNKNLDIINVKNPSHNPFSPPAVPF